MDPRMKHEDLEKIDKPTLIKIIDLYNSLSTKNLIENINSKVENLEEGIKKDIIKSRIDSINTSLTQKKYEKKKTSEFCTYYFYAKNISIYFKITPPDIFDEISTYVPNLVEKKILIVEKNKQNEYCLFKDKNLLDFKKKIATINWNTVVKLVVSL